MAIWKLTPNPSVEAMNALVRDTAVSTLGIVFTEVGEDFLRATMPVDSRTVQPARILHGGASVLLAETIGSQAAYMCVDPSAFRCVGLEVNANHIRSATSGFGLPPSRAG